MTSADMGPDFDRCALLIVDMQNDFVHSDGSFSYMAREHPEAAIDLPLKILVWDGTGLWVLAKRLERGTFAWPRIQPGQTRIELTPSELAALLSGLDTRRSIVWPSWHRLSA